jgi:hypothetical protein
MSDLNQNIIKVQTGFPSLLAMLGYIAVICSGNIQEITTTTSTTLTWFEEWYAYFEILYGKSLSRWVDAELKYMCNHQLLRDIYDNKLKKVLSVRSAWPRYVTIQEDETYRNNITGKWIAYEGRRVVMFDNTIVNMIQPSDGGAQRATYSLYYSGNVGKGAVFIQPCGWIGTHVMWTGGVSDLQYMKEGEVFSTLNKRLLTCPFENDTTRQIPFTVVLDRGYRITMEARREGGHAVIQPVFASDRHFTTVEILVSSTISKDRSGNERAVKYARISDYIKKGLYNNESTDRLCNTWLAWGFQVNFVYLPVH